MDGRRGLGWPLVCPHATLEAGGDAPPPRHAVPTEVDAMRLPLRAPARPAALPALLRTGGPGGGARRWAGWVKAAGDGLTRGLGDCTQARADVSGTREAASAAILPTATVVAGRVGDGWADALATSAAAAGAVSHARCESVVRGHGSASKGALAANS